MMTIKQAVNLFKKSQPTLIPWSYLVINDGIIINTKSIVPRPTTSRAQYLVMLNGDVIGIDNLMYEYDLKDFKRIPISLLV